MALESTANGETCRDILRMWLRWNDASQQITERMYDERHDPDKLREMLDDLERLREEAISASRQLLSS